MATFESRFLIRLIIILLILPILILSASIGYGDRWKLDPEVKDTEFSFGNTRIVLHYDSTNNQYFPEYTLKVYFKEELVGDLAGIGFEKVFASPENSYFLGVSNKGLIRQAYVIFNSKGNLLMMQEHDDIKIKYCEASITLYREWYDEENPNVEFEMVNGELIDVIINHCDGTRYSLIRDNS